MGGNPRAARGRSSWLLDGYAQAAVAVLGATTLAWPTHQVFEPANLTMLYLVAVVLVAARYGRGPALVASFGSVAAFDFFFVPPYLTFAVADAQYLVTFAVMLLVALVIGGLTARVRRQAEEAATRERHATALYAMSRELAEATSIHELLARGARHLGSVFDAAVAIFLADRSGRLVLTVDEGAFQPTQEHCDVAGRVFDRGRAAAPRARETTADDAVYLPLRGPRAPLGVAAVRPRAPASVATADARRQLETFLNQMALAVERAQLDADARAARLHAETERLRSTLLTSISHDLRTPLATITGAATTILERGQQLDPATRHELLESVRDEADRLNRLVQNLLQMTRLESGALQPRKDWHPLEEIVGAALARLATALGARTVSVALPPDLPLVPVDDVLLEQVLLNLLDNAIKHTPADSAILIRATAGEAAVTVEVADRGPGLPPGDEDRVFEKFYQASDRGRRGAGLGLAICRGIIEAHGGRMRAHSGPDGGATFAFTLPLSDAPRPVAPVDA
ncbi:MAG TPA: DUF4118 domain-containing protein [Candidatus Tectomicrobia bacterium]|nr:DUF4118 domain-containing protein [Candidatus Tectomicrobia bacterium]